VYRVDTVSRFCLGVLYRTRVPLAPLLIQRSKWFHASIYGLSFSIFFAV
jgi:hypothetical protein